MEVNDPLEKKKEQANKLVQEILKIKNDSQTFQDSIKRLYDKINSKDQEFSRHIEFIDNFKQTSKDVIETLKYDKNKIQTLLNQVNTFYESKYLPLLEQIEHKESGFKARITKNNNLNKELEKIKKECSNKYVEIKKYVIEYQKKLKELSVLNLKIRKLADSVEKNKLKSDKFLSSITIANNEVVRLISEIRSEKKESSQLFTEIQRINENSQKCVIDIKTNHEEANEKLIAIQKIYEIAHETGLSGEFENRRNHLKVDINKWEKRIFIISFVLLIGLIVLFICQLWLYKWDLTNKTFDVNFYVRFLILSPIVFYLTFCSTQYSKTKKLYDKYSFKTTLAMSIKFHIELLTQNDKFQDKESMDKLLDFIINAFKKIYDEPYNDENYKMKIKLSNLELNLQKRFLEKLDEIKTKTN